MATKAQSTGADALVETVTEADSSALVVVVWPKLVTLRNNSGMQLVEPVTGKFLFAFSSEVVELHSQEQADAVVDNLRSLACVNGLGDALTIDGLSV